MNKYILSKKEEETFYTGFGKSSLGLGSGMLVFVVLNRLYCLVRRDLGGVRGG